jgi:hypothetical protein
MMNIDGKTFYNSSNGDRWQLIRHENPARLSVRHEPNEASGGQATETTAADFLMRNMATPQGEALREQLRSSGMMDFVSQHLNK